MKELKKYKEKIKEDIEKLINIGDIEEAEKIILEYEEIVKDDVDIFSIKAVILIMKNEFIQAEKLLVKSLNFYGEVFDLLFNLAYLYEITEKHEKCYYYYLKAKDKCNDSEIKENIQVTLNNLKNKYNVDEYIQKKRVLILAQIFPPMGGSGVQRTLKFTKYLREFNYEPIVITVGKTFFNYLKDDCLIKEIPESLDVIRFDERLNFNTNQVTNLIDKYERLINNKEIISEYKDIINELIEKDNMEELTNTLLIPDLSSFWAMDVLNEIDEVVDFNSIDIIYSTSGPYSDHIIGYFLKERFNKPWICDFRDEWSNNPYADFNKENIFYKIIRSMEINILNKCNKLITISDLAKENYISDLNVSEDKISVITNGYDENDFKNIKYNKEKNNKFKIIHNGILYMIRTPETFLLAIKKLIDELKIDKDKIEIIFSYTEDKEKWTKYLKENNMESIVTFKEYMPHDESLNLSINSDMLLLIVGQGEKNKGVYTGKVFEYLRMGKPILALSPKGSVVEKLLEETKSGQNYDFENIAGISDYIYRIYTEWERKHENTYILNGNINKYERKELTRELVGVFNEELELRNLDAIKKIELEHENIKEEDFNNVEKLMKKILRNNPNDFRILAKLADIYYKKNRYYESYKFYNMAIEKCNYKYISEDYIKIKNSILKNNLNNISEFTRNKKYNFIVCGSDMNNYELNILQQIGEIKGVIREYSSNINIKLIDLKTLNYINYDYIIVLEKNKEIKNKIINVLKDIKVEETQIFDFYSYSYPYFIDGFKVKLNNILKKEKIQTLVTGLSYAEIGIDCDKLSKDSFNFALSGQDIFYNYELIKYLMKFSFIKNNLKYVLINVAYYAFDYNLSLGDQFARIHRYYYELGETNHYNNRLHLKICQKNYECYNYEEDYNNYNRHKLNTVLNGQNEEEDKVAIKQATMNYPNTKIENEEIFEKLIRMLNYENIIPIIVILPTSEYYYKHFEDDFQKNKFYEILGKLDEKYDFKILDYFKSTMFENTDFWDYSHLNKNGRRKFTEIIKKELNKYIY